MFLIASNRSGTHNKKHIKNNQISKNESRNLTLAFVAFVTYRKKK